MNDIEQLTRGWRKLEVGEIIQAGDCFIFSLAGNKKLHYCSSLTIGCTVNDRDEIYRRTDADLIKMLHRASMWIRTAGESGFADEILDLIKERT